MTEEDARAEIVRICEKQGKPWLVEMVDGHIAKGYLTYVEQLEMFRAKAAELGIDSDATRAE